MMQSSLPWVRKLSGLAHIDVVHDILVMGIVAVVIALIIALSIVIVVAVIVILSCNLAGSPSAPILLSPAPALLLSAPVCFKITLHLPIPSKNYKINQNEGE